MGRKLATVGVAIVVLAALALPAAAGAAPQLVDGGKALAKGAKIFATSTNALITKTALGTVACQDLTSGLTVTSNTGTHIEANSFVGAKDTCLISEEPGKVSVTKPTFIELTTKEKDEGTVRVTFIMDVGPFECHFEGKGRFTYVTKTDVVKIGIEGDKGITLKAVELCVGEEPGGQPAVPTFHGEFTIYTEDLTPVTIE